MKTKTKAIIVCCCAAFLYACYEDKGHYDLVDYNKIEITTVSALTTTTAIHGDTLRVTPKITWKYPERDTSSAAFEYRWEVSDELVSQERDLVYVPTRMGTLPCVLFVTERATGVVTRWSTSFTVNSPYNVGWVILSEQGGRSMLNFIRRDERRDADNVRIYYWTDFVDLYASMYPDDPLPASASQVIAYPVDYYADEVIVISGSGEDYVLDGMGLKKTFRLQDDFIGGQYPSGFIPKSFARGGGADFVLGINGQVLWRKNAAPSQMFHTDPIMQIPIYFPGDSEIDYFVRMNIYASSFIFMYDKLHNRLVACYTSFSSGNDIHGGKMEILYSSPPGEFADINDFGAYKLVYCGEHSDGRSFNNILKDPVSGKYLLQEFTVSASLFSMTVTQANQREFEASNLVTDNSVFWRMRNSSYLYFGEGSDLYFYDFNTRVTKLYTRFGDARVTRLMQDIDGTRLGVALDNGEFYLFDAISATVLGSSDPGEAGFLHKVSGLGTIKDLTWKHGGYYNLVFNRY
ncbi:MAG: hypothetical protein LBF09_04320 [Odoribacteraceae bacterium]|jgi:hypothetical protein|nr:hypothetical protein [Odoribacteraceae bacterium]